MTEDATRTKTNKTSPYLIWAKAHHEVRYNLASSGVAPPSLDLLGVTRDDFCLTDEHEDGWAPLMERIAERYEVAPAHVALAQGTSMANHLVCALFLEPGERVLVERPYYEPLHLVPRFFHAEVDFFDRPRAADFRIDVARIEEALTDDTRLVVLSNLHNPTGQLATTEELERLAPLAERKDFHVLIDEVYLEWLYEAGERTASSISDRFITTRSLTKAYGLDAVRAGWILADETVAERLRRLMDLYSVKMAHASERLALRALDHAEAILAPLRGRLEENRERVTAFVKGHEALSWTPPPAGSVGLVYWEGDVDALVHELEARDALVAPGRFFGVDHAFRIGFGMPREILEEGLSRLDEALALA